MGSRLRVRVSLCVVAYHWTRRAFFYTAAANGQAGEMTGMHIIQQGAGFHAKQLCCLYC